MQSPPGFWRSDPNRRTLLFPPFHRVCHLEQGLFISRLDGISYYSPASNAMARGMRLPSHPSGPPCPLVRLFSPKQHIPASALCSGHVRGHTGGVRGPCSDSVSHHSYLDVLVILRSLFTADTPFLIVDHFSVPSVLHSSSFITFIRLFFLAYNGAHIPSVSFGLVAAAFFFCKLIIACEGHYTESTDLQC